ncbi:MAG: acyl-CoA thioesterase II [Hyphomicrobiales bacterium]|nr:acyl-CoA thioesterase II [Hyphomicrobiales bacterium]
MDATTKDPAPLARLLSQLDLEPIEVDIFRAAAPRGGWKRVFGGLVVSQALVAAQRTVEGRAPHSLHAYFMLGGDPEAAIVYQVERMRDGGSFTTRRTTAIQHGRPIFTMIASFQAEEPGFSHHVPMPDVPGPEGLPDDLALLAAAGAPPQARHYFSLQKPVEFRVVDASRYLGRAAAGGPAPAVARQDVWVRAAGTLSDDPAQHRAMLAYISDYTLLDTALVAHGRTIFEPEIQVASLDHALWFHRPFRADEWLLYAQDSPNASGARGLTRGMFFARDGSLVATAMQEGLIRRRTR